MEQDEVLICWCLMRQLETEDVGLIADIMGLGKSHTLLLMSEADWRFRRGQERLQMVLEYNGEGEG